MRETQVQSLGWKDPLKKGMATHCSILVWRIPWSLVSYSPWGRKESDTTKRLSLSTCFFPRSLAGPCVWEEVVVVNASGKEYSKYLIFHFLAVAGIQKYSFPFPLFSVVGSKFCHFPYAA